MTQENYQQLSEEHTGYGAPTYGTNITIPTAAPVMTSQNHMYNASAPNMHYTVATNASYSYQTVDTPVIQGTNYSESASLLPTSTVVVQGVPPMKSDEANPAAIVLLIFSIILFIASFIRLIPVTFFVGIFFSIAGNVLNIINFCVHRSGNPKTANIAKAALMLLIIDVVLSTIHVSFGIAVGVIAIAIYVIIVVLALGKS